MELMNYARRSVHDWYLSNLFRGREVQGVYHYAESLGAINAEYGLGWDEIIHPSHQWMRIQDTRDELSQQPSSSRYFR